MTAGTDTPSGPPRPWPPARSIGTASRDVRQNRLERWTEQLAGHAVNVCDCDEPCPPCARCEHAFCRHHDDGLLARQCLTSGCGCHLWLSDTDCPECDGQGVVSIDVEGAGGRVLEDDRPCPWCRGTGTRHD